MIENSAFEKNRSGQDLPPGFRPNLTAVSTIEEISAGDIFRLKKLHESVTQTGCSALKRILPALSIASPKFPEWLKADEVMHVKRNGYDRKHIVPDPGMPLWVSGPDVREALSSRFSAAIVGTTSPSRAAEEIAFKIAYETIRRAKDSGTGAVIISGGVMGIDMATHLGAVAAGGRTLAVLASSPVLGLHPYPQDINVPAPMVCVRAKLLEDIFLHGGGLLSVTDRENFTAEERKPFLELRDTIITGLSDVVLVIQAKNGSATVETVRKARLQGKRAVYALDWRYGNHSMSEQEISGNSYLIDNKLAIGIPCSCSADLEDWMPPLSALWDRAGTTTK